MNEITAFLSALGIGRRLLDWTGWIVATLGLAGAVKGILRRLASAVVVTHRLTPETGNAVVALLAPHRVFAASERLFASERTFVPRERRVRRLVWEVLDDASHLYLWRGRRPIWIRKWRKDDNASPGSGIAWPMFISFVRGTVDWDALLLEAMRAEDERFDAINANAGGQPRHFFHRVHGIRKTESGAVQASPGSMNALDATTGRRPIGFGPESFQRPEARASLDDLFLAPDARRAVEAVRFWLQHQAWHEDRGLAWRLGLLFHGEPGTGKSSLARAMAEDFDLPLFSFDLATLDNREFEEAWFKCRANAPAMALLEDFDAVFEGRKNVSPEGAGGGLTFDCVLNTVAGAARADGVLLVVTTNHADAVDPALGRPIADGVPGADEDDSTRPGRIDMAIEFGPLDEAGRYAIAARIVRDPVTEERLVRDGAGDSGARFVFRCTKEARRAFLASLREATNRAAAC